MNYPAVWQEIVLSILTATRFVTKKERKEKKCQKRSTNLFIRLLLSAFRSSQEFITQEDEIFIQQESKSKAHAMLTRLDGRGKGRK